MPACSRCGGRICKGEVKCFNCELPVAQGKSNREANLGRFNTVVTIFFFLCIGLTIASLFIDIGPSFWKCAAATVILHFVKKAAGEMSESNS